MRASTIDQLGITVDQLTSNLPLLNSTILAVAKDDSKIDANAEISGSNCSFNWFLEEINLLLGGVTSFTNKDIDLPLVSVGQLKALNDNLTGVNAQLNHIVTTVTSNGGIQSVQSSPTLQFTTINGNSFQLSNYFQSMITSLEGALTPFALIRSLTSTTKYNDFSKTLADIRRDQAIKQKRKST